MKRFDRFDDFIKANQGFERYGGFDYNDFCMLPDAQLPTKFKVLEFSKYNSARDPVIHLKIFCYKLGKPSGDDKLPMRLFEKAWKMML